MAETYRVTYSRRAADQIAQIFEYIGRDSPDNAVKMAQRLVNSIESLELLPHQFPFLWHSVALGAGVRSMSVRPYLVRYKISESARTVTII